MPLVCDMSSNILSRPVDISKVGMMCLNNNIAFSYFYSFLYKTEYVYQLTISIFSTQ